MGTDASAAARISVAGNGSPRGGTSSSLHQGDTARKGALRLPGTRQGSRQDLGGGKHTRQSQDIQGQAKSTPSLFSQKGKSALTVSPTISPGETVRGDLAARRLSLPQWLHHGQAPGSGLHSGPGSEVWSKGPAHSDCSTCCHFPGDHGRLFFQKKATTSPQGTHGKGVCPDLGLRAS